ncbi:MAG: acetyl-CoA carboxylase biotin carboxyl carrier protein subunit [Alphaproteobacteria bacterium]|nr:acetyl-CoA carboxylase biotin carboxyl carrier protein subunit [Alphaproteobacteria bacterium]
MATERVLSEISGQVCRIEAAVGDRVSEDDAILFIESMKMEIPVSATTGGVIKELLVATGDSVTEGTPLAILET